MSKELTVAQVAAIGGKARADSLSADKRSQIARNAVNARWEKAGKGVPKATHSGDLRIGTETIPCAVLEDKTRVLTQRGFSTALGRYKNPKKSSIVELPPFLAASNLKPFIGEDLIRSSTPIKFRMAEGSGGLGGNIALGYRAELLPQVCNVYLQAKHAGKLFEGQSHIADQCLMLLSGFATVGIIALVDEATGYQYDRPRRELEEQLKKYLSDSLRKWVRTFPADYFKHLCRLRGVDLRQDMKLPLYFGHITRNLVYRRIAPGLLKKLEERREERGSRANKLHSWLSLDYGVPELLVHLGQLVGIMKRHTSYDEFEKEINQLLPPYPKVPGLFDDPKDWESR